jgi:peptidoglycan LD-endopeptidase LytH
MLTNDQHVSISTLIMKAFIFIILLSLAISCKMPMKNIFGKKSPHEQYSDRITNAGLHQTELGRLWFDAAKKSLNDPVDVSLPYREAGYFTAERPQATGIRFNAKRGEKLQIDLKKRPDKKFTIYMDLLQEKDPEKEPKQLASSDSTNIITWEVERDGNYLIRLQPELLTSGDYTLTITNGPTLAYPIKAKGTGHIQSFWSDPRDGGVRKHEGVDFFTARKTPAVAAAKGTVVTVNQNNLGGNVIWMRPAGKNYVLYYAHLDTQLVKSGQSVDVGDTLGLVGNTGNAKYTVPHLHFGIYTLGGAIDPLYFVKPAGKEPPKIDGSLNDLGKSMQSGNKKINLHKAPGKKDGSVMLEKNTLIRIEGATDNWYKVSLPNGQTGYVDHSTVSSLKKIKNHLLHIQQPLYDKPDTSAARKTILAKGENVDVIGVFGDYYFVNTKDEMYGWIFK